MLLDAVGSPELASRAEYSGSVALENLLAMLVALARDLFEKPGEVAEVELLLLSSRMLPLLFSLSSDRRDMFSEGVAEAGGP